MDIKEIEALVLRYTDGSKSVSRIKREIDRDNGTNVPLEAVVEIVSKLGIPTPNRVKPTFEKVFEQHQYGIWVTRYRTGAAPYGGPRLFQIDTIQAASATEALIKWQIKAYQEDPSDPNLLLLPPMIQPLPGLRRPSQGSKNRIDAFKLPCGGSENISELGLVTNFSETPKFLRWERVEPNGDRIPVTEDEIAIAESEWEIPNEGSIIQLEAGWWKRVRRIWGDNKAQQLKDWLNTHFSKNEWIWFEQQKSKLIASTYEREAFSSTMPADWQPQAVEPKGLAEKGFLLRFPWEQCRQFCLQGYEKEMLLNPDPQAGKGRPLPVAQTSQKPDLTEEQFIELCREQWAWLRENVGEYKLRLIAGRLACNSGISPLSVSSAKKPFINIALKEFWQNKIPPAVMAYALWDWKKTRDLTVVAGCL